MKIVFGASIAVLLLGLYAYVVVVGILIASGMLRIDFHQGYTSTLSTIGGLVSALVIAELATTKPGEAPGARFVDNAGNVSETVRKSVKWISWTYVFVWMLLGLASYVSGTFVHYNKLPTLTNHGQAWLGLAVTASYAYFGLSAPSSTQKQTT